MEEKRREAEKGSTLDYFSLLGVSQDASQGEIEARYRELTDHLASAAIPATLRDWADREAALVDEAYAILSDPELRAELERGGAHPSRDINGAQLAEAAVAIDASETAQAQSAPEVRQEAPREQSVSAAQALLFGVPWKLMALGAAIGAVVLGIVFFGAELGLGGGDDAPATAQGSDLAQIDTERVAELMAIVQADPNDVEATFELGEIFFLGGEWQSGIDWFTKLLKLDPSSVHAYTDVGTANFNLGQNDAAKAAWLEALKIDPNDVQVHYNMGFFYSNVDPVDVQAAINEWQAVVQLAPGSDLASTAQVHMDSLAAEASPGASPAATEAPASP
jgi:tetratricopeptide (TPR) repeat protein